jgi:phycoerythrin-associated linker protein
MLRIEGGSRSQSFNDFLGGMVMALWITESDDIQLHANATEADLQVVIAVTYRQVLGNAYVMEDQRLTTAESQLRNRDITVKEFVRAVAKSELYRTRFFETSSPYRFVELNFKHLLGRAPQNQAEVSEQVQRFNSQGYEAVIDGLLDSDEYSSCFGEDTVPTMRGGLTQPGIKNVGFNRTLALSRGYAASDVESQAVLLSDVAANLATKPQSPMGGYSPVTTTAKRYCISLSCKLTAATTHRACTRKVIVRFDQLSQEIQYLHRIGAKISRITEVA